MAGALAAEFNQVSTSYFDKTMKISELKVSQHYRVLSFKAIIPKNKVYGTRSIVVTLQFTREKIVQVFLPKRFEGMFTDERISLFNKGGEELFLIYEGIGSNREYVVKLLSE